MKQKSAILQMLHGERGHFELMPYRRTKEYDKWADEQERLHQDLKDGLGEETAKLIDQLVSAVEFKNLEDLDGHYLEGFKFGLLIGLEVLSKDADDID